jgi:hypothetical protein
MEDSVDFQAPGLQVRRYHILAHVLVYDALVKFFCRLDSVGLCPVFNCLSLQSM